MNMYDVLLAKKLSGGGGGGSSDFSVVDVTFINTDPNDYYIVSGLPHLIGENMTIEPFNVPNSPVTVSVPAYKNGFYYPGVVFDNIDPTFMPVEAGGVSFDFEVYAFVVSGDGTFTAKGTEGE